MPTSTRARPSVPITWPEFVTAQCPLAIEAADWSDPVLVISGPQWSLSCTSAWRLVVAERLVAGGEDPSAVRQVEALAGRTVVRCEALTSPALGDLRLRLDDGRALEVFVATAVDPWVLQLPRGAILVPSPADPNWAAGFDELA